MSRPSARTAFAALAGAALLVTAGCGVSLDEDASPSAAGGGTESPASGGNGSGGNGSGALPAGGSFEGTGGAVYLSQAADATSGVTTQKMSMEMVMEGVPSMGSIAITSEGAFDNEAGQGHMTMDMGDVFGGMGEGAGLPDDAGVMEMVIDGDVVYMKSPLFAMLGDEDKPWQRIDAEDLQEGGAMSGGAQSDPGEFLAFLEAAGDDVTEVGTEEVRGVETTHVTATLDLQKMLADAPADEQAELEQQLEGLGAAADTFTEIPAEAWIDADGYVRRFTMDFDFSGAAEADPELAGVTMTMTIELYDFDEPVDIEIPDPAEVGELDPSLLGGN